MSLGENHRGHNEGHTGEVGQGRYQFSHGLAMARAAVESFQAHWGKARQERFVDSQTRANQTGPETLRRLVGRGGINIPHIKPAALLDTFRSAWQAEPGDNVADALNAAHVKSWNTAWTFPR